MRNQNLLIIIFISFLLIIGLIICLTKKSKYESPPLTSTDFNMQASTGILPEFLEGNLPMSKGTKKYGGGSVKDSQKCGSYETVSGDSCFGISQSLCGVGKDWAKNICDSDSVCTLLQAGKTINYDCSGTHNNCPNGSNGCLPEFLEGNLPYLAMPEGTKSYSSVSVTKPSECKFACDQDHETHQRFPEIAPDCIAWMIDPAGNQDNCNTNTIADPTPKTCTLWGPSKFEDAHCKIKVDPTLSPNIPKECNIADNKWHDDSTIGGSPNPTRQECADRWMSWKKNL